ncbi:hypothetical protein Hanom_Chr14g01283471 [Helianthus anomalus]
MYLGLAFWRFSAEYSCIYFVTGLPTKEKEAMDAIIEDVISQHNGGEDAMEIED